MEETNHLYMKRYRPNYAIIIQYCWGKYYIARLSEGSRGKVTYTLKQYKTLSGAENYLKRYVEPYGDNQDIVPELYYGDEPFIKKGEYWRA